MTTYFDRISRTIRVATEGKTGPVEFVDSVFNPLGQLVATSDPHAAVDATVHWAVKTYDEYGRVAAESRADAPGLAAQPASVAEYLRRGGTREAGGDLAGALADYEAAAKREATNRGAVFALGRVRQQKEDWDGAIRDFSRAIALDETFAPAFASRGSCLRAKGDFAGALSDLSRAVELAPDDADHWDLRGDVKMERHEIEPAIADYTKAIELDAKNSIYRYDRGKAKLKAHEYDGAISDLTEAIRLDPKRDLPFYRRAQARMGKGDRAGAIADYSSAIELQPKDYTHFRARGVARYLTGDFRGALADFEQAIAVADEPVPYPHFWSFLLRRRLGLSVGKQDLSAVMAATKDDWIKTLARLLNGTLAEQKILAGAPPGPGPTAVEQQCEAFYYAGMLRLLNRDLAGARVLFERSAGTNLPDFYEQIFATAELQRLPGPKDRK